MNCPFCNNKNIQPRIIYKDRLVMAFPGNMPIVSGHTLVCPIRHIAKIDDLSAKELKMIKEIIIRLKNSLKNSLGAEGFNVAWNEGSMAGQTVGHLHIHVVPRKTGDTGIYHYEPRKFLYRPGSRNTTPAKELQEIARLIKKNLSKVGDRTADHNIKNMKPPLSKKARSLQLGRYIHYKGKNCKVIGVARHSETLEELVVYEEGGLWVRPLEMFLEKVEVEGKKVPRFRYVQKQAGIFPRKRLT